MSYINQDIKNLFYNGNFKHIGTVTAVQWRGRGIYNDVAFFNDAVVFQDHGDVVDRFIGSRKLIIVVAAYAPDQVQSCQHVHAIRENVNFDGILWSVTRYLKGGIARAGHADNGFGINIFCSIHGIHTNCIRKESP